MGMPTMSEVRQLYTRAVRLMETAAATRQSNAMAVAEVLRSLAVAVVVLEMPNMRSGKTTNAGWH